MRQNVSCAFPLWAVLSAMLGAPVAPSAELSPGQSALRQAMDSGQHLFVLFHRKDDAATQAMRATLEAEIAQRPADARLVVLNVQDPAEQEWVNLWKLSRSPMPLTMAIAPNRAITGGFPLRITPEQIDNAIVSPGTAACLLAGQTQKLVVLCVHQGEQFEVPAGVQAFQRDPNYGPATQVVAIRGDDPAEAGFLKTLKITPQATTLTALIAPPGRLLATYSAEVTPEQFIATLKTAQSSCCPGGKCGPGGCCPTGPTISIAK